MFDLEKMARAYHETAPRGVLYIIGFEYQGRIYEVVDDHIDDRFLSADHASDGDEIIRLTIGKTHAAMARNWRNATMIGKTADVLKGEGNKGEQFERFVCEQYGVEYVKDNHAYYERPDIETRGGLRFQVKFHRATVAKVRTIAKAMEGV